MNEAVIVAGKRTPIGAFQGALSSFKAPQLGSLAIKAALEAAGVQPGQIDEVIMGCVLTGGMGQAPARQASLGAGIPDSVPCLTINKVCGSGMKAVMLAAQAIRLGDSEVVLAGGMESMTNAPYVLDKARDGYRMGNGTIIDSMINDGLWDPYNDCHMGNCGDRTAAEFSISREELDRFAAQSYTRSMDAAKRLAEEIVPVEVPQRKGDPIVVCEDEEPQRGNVSKLAGLRPAFDKAGVTTAGNASSINDGACAMVVASSARCEKEGWRPIARIKGYATHAQEPQWFTTAPAFAIEKLLKQANLHASDIDLFEVNEAFAVVSLIVAQKAGIPEDKLNVNGGAVALGHPIGATGARLILTAAMELKRKGGRYAVATPCIGGGEATAILIEAI